MFLVAVNRLGFAGGGGGVAKGVVCCQNLLFLTWFMLGSLSGIVPQCFVVHLPDKSRPHPV